MPAARTSLIFALASVIAIRTGCGSSEPERAEVPRQEPGPPSVDGVTRGGTPYRITSYQRDGLLCVELRTESAGGAGGCGDAPSAGSATVLQAALVGGEIVVFGAVRPDVARVEVRSVETGGALTARPTPGRLVQAPLPTAWKAPEPTGDSEGRAHSSGSEAETGPPASPFPVLDLIAYASNGEELMRSRLEPPGR